ncbi:MAG: DUF551 domain-containing protein, partial [Lachnospiraceae bacterium]|nr:DUF551 domain-containing protein [Lachnospiraceae bacterium]
MAKYIDADALIMHLSDYALTESPNDTDSMKDRLIHETAYNAINECIKAVKEMPAADVEPVRRWIPCSGRLPEISCYVLAYYENMS